MIKYRHRETYYPLSTPVDSYLFTSQRNLRVVIPSGVHLPTAAGYQIEIHTRERTWAVLGFAIDAHFFDYINSEASILLPEQCC